MKALYRPQLLRLQRQLLSLRWIRGSPAVTAPAVWESVLRACQRHPVTRKVFTEALCEIVSGAQSRIVFQTRLVTKCLIYPKIGLQSNSTTNLESALVRVQLMQQQHGHSCYDTRGESPNSSAVFCRRLCCVAVLSHPK